MNQFLKSTFRRWCAVLSLTVGISLCANADPVEVDGLYYELNTTDRTATLTYETTNRYNYNNISPQVVIPRTINYDTVEFTVRAIADRAFANCTVIESISIPGTVAKIGSAVSTLEYLPFYKCSSLKNIIFEDGVDEIFLAAYINSNYLRARGLFEDCPLEEVYVGRNIKYSNSGFWPFFEENPSIYGYSAFYGQEKLTKITFGETVTDIPPYLFYKNASLTLMTLPAVKNIGKAAFRSCSKLTTLNLGTNLEVVGDETFYDCKNITKLTFPDATKAIGNRAFFGCASVTEVTVGSGLESIGDSVFYNCSSFTALVLPDGFTNMGVSAFEGCSKLTIAKLGSSLNFIPQKAFKDCISLSEIVVPSSVSCIDDQAFYNDSGMATITMNEGLQTIGDEVFWNNSGVVQFSIPGTVTSIGSNCFYGCTHASYFTFCDGDEPLIINNVNCRSSIIDATHSSYTDRIYDYFYDCPIRFLTLGRNLKYNFEGKIWMNDFNGTSFEKKYRSSAPFANKPDLRSVTIGPKVTFLYHYLFDGCENITSLNFGERVDSIYTYAFRNCDNLTKVEFPASLSNIGESAFYNCDKIEEIVFPASSMLNTIHKSGFYECKKLKKVEFPASLKTIWDSAFFNCAELEEIVFSESSGLSYIGESAFCNCDKLIEIEFPASLTQISPSAFAGCDLLTSTTFRENSDSSLTIQGGAFGDCAELFNVVFPGQLSYIGRYAYTQCPKLKDVIFNDNNNDKSYLRIDDYAFEKCPNIESLSFPGRLTSIGNFVFRECTNLSDITFRDSSERLKLGYGASSSKTLFGDSNLQSLYMGRNIEYDVSETYGFSPFYNQKMLKDVRFSQAGTVTYCKDNLLRNVNGCEELILPESLLTIGNRTFAGMSDLKGITIPNNVKEIDVYAFSDDSCLKYANLSTSCPWLKEGLFSSCDSLEAIVIPPVVTKMDKYLFSNCKSLATVTFEGSSENLIIDYGASQKNYGLFRDCPVETLNLDRWLSYDTGSAEHSPFYSLATLKHINFGENVKVVDKYMFTYCTGLEELYLPDNIESVGLWGFRGCTALEKVRFSEKLSQVSDFGFADCTSLDNVVFPASMTSVADNSFSNCTSLKKLDLGNSLLIIGPSAFKNNSSLEGIEIPETLYGLGVEAFANCTSLPYVAIKSISSVGRQAFEGCTGLKWISLSEKTTSLGENSFAGCTNIGYVKSYAQLPPEGLVNFVESVPVNGTLFVPENSIDYYKYSPTWEDWMDIRPLNDNVMATGVTIDKTEISFKATETILLTASVVNDDSTDKGIVWRTADAEIASVDEQGLVTAISVGETIVTALAADGSGVKAECKVTVNPTLIESIAIINGETTLKKGRSIELATEIQPVTATNKDIVWTSSNTKIASVDGNGMVTAISAGEVVLTAGASDGSGIQAEISLVVIPPMKGDSNDNDNVTITDAVNTANYAVGNEVENFCFEAADVNSDNRITLTDASGTITVILDQTVENNAKAFSVISRNDIERDNLYIEDFHAGIGENTTIAVKLEGTIDYVALQADIIVPDGIVVESIEEGLACDGHILSTKRIKDNVIRLVLFDIENSAFIDNNEAVINLNIRCDNYSTENLSICNIIAADAKANEYVLTSTVGNNLGVTGIEAVSSSEIKVCGEKGKIKILNAEDKLISIYNVEGLVLANYIGKSNIETFNVATGVYIVVAGDQNVKVIVK